MDGRTAPVGNGCVSLLVTGVALVCGVLGIAFAVQCNRDLHKLVTPTHPARLAVGQSVHHRVVGELVIAGRNYFDGWRYECRRPDGSTAIYAEQELLANSATPTREPQEEKDNDGS